MAPVQTRRGAAPWVRGVATALGTLVVVVLEFALLTAVYHSGDGARSRHEAFVGAESALTTWAPGVSTAPVIRAYDRADRASGSRAGEVRAALGQWRRTPMSLTSQQRLRTATDRLGDRLAHEKRVADWRAAGIHAGLLALVSVGWFLWFRRVVQRHRDLEHTLTEAQVAVAGEQRLTALVRNSVDMVAVIEPDSAVSFVSPSASAVTGHDAETLLGRSILSVLEPDDAAIIGSLMGAAREGDHAVSLRVQHADGRWLALEGTMTNLLDDEAVGGWVLTTRDVTDRLALQEELTRQALQDTLTGLANRRLFSDRLSHALRRRAGDVHPLVVLFLDLDDFKDVNDSRGHGVGDQLLVKVAERVSDAIRTGDTAARLGGDEFAVLMEDIEPETARQVAERLVASIAEPIQVGEEELVVHVSVGLAAALPGVTDGEETLRNADVAMYWAKDRGKGTVAVYDAVQHSAALERLELQNELVVAIREGQLVLHYQPNVDLATGEIVAFEALVRWEHPDRGLLPPSAFVPMAEQSGLVVPMGTWVLREACRAAAEDLSVGGRAPDIAVNVAARQIADPGFVDLVTGVLAETGLEPTRLKLEITESTLLQDRKRVVEKLGELRRRGVWVAVDDFGTGYSSLSYLADLPVDVLKIDKSFVDQICGEGGPLVDAIVGLADSLRLVTVAEGVETADQARRLGATHCAVGQGYLWSRPVPLRDAAALVADDLTGPRFHALHAGPPVGPPAGGPEELGSGLALLS